MASKIETVVLKLTGKQTYLNALLDSVVFKKGDVIRMPLEIAGKIAGLHERREETNIYHFTNVTNQRGNTVTHDLSTDEYLAAKKRGADKAELASIALVNAEARAFAEPVSQGVQNDKEVVANLEPESGSGQQSQGDEGGEEEGSGAQGGEDTGSPDGGPVEDSADAEANQSPAAKRAAPPVKRAAQRKAQ